MLKGQEDLDTTSFLPRSDWCLFWKTRKKPEYIRLLMPFLYHWTETTLVFEAKWLNWYILANACLWKVMVCHQLEVEGMHGPHPYPNKWNLLLCGRVVVVVWRFHVVVWQNMSKKSTELRAARAAHSTNYITVFWRCHGRRRYSVSPVLVIQAKAKGRCAVFLHVVAQ